MFWQKISGLGDRIEQQGYAVLPAVFSSSTCQQLAARLGAIAPSHRAGERHLLEKVPELCQLAIAGPLAAAIQTALGPDAFAIRATLFSKHPEANWQIRWHQDRIIPVREQHSTEGFSGWSMKDGQLHVQPPTAVLESMLAARIHLDDTPEDRGPLVVIPGSHRSGKLSGEAKQYWVENNTARPLAVFCGDVILMRPLLLHRSSRLTQPAYRRVIHIEYAIATLPEPLCWPHAYKLSI